MLPDRRIGPFLVHAIGYGAMSLSLRGRPDEAEALAVLDAALDHGMNLVDTADVYCIDHRDIGHNERLIAKGLARRAAGDGVLVATKGGLLRPRGDWTSNASPAHLKSACEASLRALGVACIELYQLHAPDDQVPFADSIGALAELRAQGKIRHVGLSNVSVEEIRIAASIVPIVSVQNRFNVLDPSPILDGVLAHCTREGIALLAYSPVGGLEDAAELGRHPVLRRVGERRGASPYQVALAWLLGKSPVVIPIPGASRVGSVVSSAAAMELELDARDMAELDGTFLG